LSNHVKNYELRKNDRDFEAEDILELAEIDPTDESFTGLTLQRKVTHVLKGEDAERFGLKEGYSILSLSLVESF
jgi:hypothetical protein